MKARVRTFGTAMAAIAIVGMAPSIASALDSLTGFYEGKIKCEQFDPGSGKTKVQKSPAELHITELSPGLIAIDQPGNPILFFGRYRGTVLEDPGKPGKAQIGFAACFSNSSPRAEVGRAKVTVKPSSIKASFKADVIATNIDVFVGKCKWTFKRVSTDDPMVPDCP